MIVLLDDTFVDRHKLHNLEYLTEEKYKNACSIYPRLKTSEINTLLNNSSGISFFGYHKSLQLFNNEEKPINKEENTRYREMLLNKIVREDINLVEFSRGLETNFESRKINKDLFYANLKPFLDHYIKEGDIEPKILFWGIDFQNLEKMLNIQKALMQIRLTDIENFMSNGTIRDTIELIYGIGISESIINEWLAKGYSKNKIVSLINKNIGG